jgi:amino acid transporter
VTAFEAKYSTSLKWPSRLIAYAIFVLYFLCTIGEILTVRWTAPYLPQIEGGVGNSSTSLEQATSPPRSASFVINATLAAGYYDLAGFLNGCLIFSVLSTSNTCLYVASRTLYGMAREIPDTNWLGRKLNRLSLVVRQTGVPPAALLFSSVSFFWLPFLQLQRGYAIQEVRYIASFSGIIHLRIPADRNHVGLRKHFLFYCLVCAMLGIYPVRALVSWSSLWVTPETEH